MNIKKQNFLIITSMENNNFFLDKTMVNTYKSCPYKYYLLFVKKVPTEETLDISEGKIFHKITCDFYDKINKDVLLNIDIEQYFRQIITDLMKDYTITKTFLYENFINFETNRFKLCKMRNNIDCFFPVYKETYFENKELMLNGVVDRIFKDFDEKLILMEIKTGKPSKYKTSIEGLTRELAIYDLLVEPYNIKFDRYLVYYPFDNSVLKIDINSKIRAKTIREIKNVRSKIISGMFQRNMSLKCRDCQVRTICLYEEKGKYETADDKLNELLSQSL
jgi:CRISPR/Cas system-associated exonuclease Cas4 (RecB family)